VVALEAEFKGTRHAACLEHPFKILGRFSEQVGASPDFSGTTKFDRPVSSSEPEGGGSH
jgi:hypothetical protein